MNHGMRLLSTFSLEAKSPDAGTATMPLRLALIGLWHCRVVSSTPIMNKNRERQTSGSPMCTQICLVLVLRTTVLSRPNTAREEPCSKAGKANARPIQSHFLQHLSACVHLRGIQVCYEPCVMSNLWKCLRFCPISNLPSIDVVPACIALHGMC